MRLFREVSLSDVPARGFTLIELMVAIAVLAVLVTIAVPSFQNLLNQNRVISTVNDLQSSMQLARSRAVTTNTSDRYEVCPITGCGSNGNNWSEGWIIYDSEEEAIIRTYSKNQDLVTVSGTPVRISFNNTGGANVCLNIVVSSVQQPDITRSVVLRRSGYSQVEGDPC